MSKIKYIDFSAAEFMRLAFDYIWLSESRRLYKLYKKRLKRRKRYKIKRRKIKRRI